MESEIILYLGQKRNIILSHLCQFDNTLQAEYTVSKSITILPGISFNPRIFQEPQRLQKIQRSNMLKHKKEKVVPDLSHTWTP